MTKAEKVAKLIDVLHPLEMAVEQCVGYFKEGFTALDAQKFPYEMQERALNELGEQLRFLSAKRTKALTTIFDRFDENELDALLLVSCGKTETKMKEMLLDINSITNQWWNEAKQLAPTMNGILVDTGVQFMVNNTEGEVADSIASQSLEDLKAGSTEPPTPNAA